MPPEVHPQHGAISAVWQYLNAAGELLQFACRFDNGGKKQVLPLTYCTDGTDHEWRWQSLPAPRPLYRLDRLGPAPSVLVVEGEKAADAAGRLLGDRLPVVTWPGGCNAVALADWSPLAGMAVVIWRDADEPGKKAALAVADTLGKIDCTVSVVEPPADVAEGWDLADALEEGWTAEQVLERIDAATSPPGRLDACAVPLEDPEEEDHPHIVERLFPADEVTLLSGHGGCGKSIMMLVAAILIALGLSFGKLKTSGCNVLFYSAEDNRQTLQRRVKKICRLLGIDRAELEGKLHLYDVSDINPALYRGESETPLLDTLAALVERLKIGLTIIDNASDVFDSKEIDRARVRQFIRLLRSHIARPGRAVVLLAHINKVSANKSRDAGTEDYSGSTAWHNSCRSRLSLSAEKDGSLKVEHLKANYGPKSEPLRLEWHEGVPMIAGTFDDRGGAAAAEILAEQQRQQDAADRAALLEIIRDFDQRGERITTAMQGPSTAFGLLKVCDGFPAHLRKDDFNRLIRDMETAGSIHRKTIKTADRKTREVFQAAPIPGSKADTGTDDQADEVAA
jgi:archaellum biogenesis ATPase FlaH